MEIRIGSPRLTIHADQQFLVCSRDGSIDAQKQEGYFCLDTRLVSTYSLTLSGGRPLLLDSSVIAPFSSRHEFVNAAVETSAGAVPGEAIHLRVDRTIHHGVHEDYDL